MKRCGKIELLRFLAAAVVIFYHTGAYTGLNKVALFSVGPVDFSFFPRGRFAVEFFFLVSGFLMAQSVFKLMSRDSGEKIRLGTETAGFVWKKLKAILPYSIFFCAIAIVTLCFVMPPEKLMDKLISSAGSIFFLQRTGLTTSGAFLSVGWYVSSMLIAMLILYPFIRKFYNMFTHVIAPILGILCIGYLLFTYKSFTGTEEWSVLTFRCNIRAIGEIALGTTCFEFCRWMSSKKFGYGMRTLFTVIEVLCYGLVLFYVMTLMFDDSYSGIAVILLMIGITMSFSRKTLLGNTKLFQNRFFGFLGSISLPMYLCQSIMTIFIAYVFKDSSSAVKIFVMFVPTLVLAILTYLAWTGIQYAWKHRKAKTGG